eukprot:jgi/Botrbrau1/14423/Bobra.0014s0070.1
MPKRASKLVKSAVELGLTLPKVGQRKVRTGAPKEEWRPPRLAIPVWAGVCQDPGIVPPGPPKQWHPDQLGHPKKHPLELDDPHEHSPMYIYLHPDDRKTRKTAWEKLFF